MRHKPFSRARSLIPSLQIGKKALSGRSSFYNIVLTKQRNREKHLFRAEILFPAYIEWINRTLFSVKPFSSLELVTYANASVKSGVIASS